MPDYHLNAVVPMPISSGVYRRSSTTTPKSTSPTQHPLRPRPSSTHQRSLHCCPDIKEPSNSGRACTWETTPSHEPNPIVITRDYYVDDLQNYKTTILQSYHLTILQSCGPTTYVCRTVLLPIHSHLLLICLFSPSSRASLVACGSTFIRHLD